MQERPSDEALALRAQRGDTAAFEELATRNIGLIKRKAAGLAARNPGGFELEDLGQEGFIGLMSAVRAYRPDCGASFRTFAQLCVERRMLSAVRSALAKKQVPSSAVVSLRQDACGYPDSQFSAGADLNPETALIAKEDYQRFWHKLCTEVSNFEQAVLELYLNGHGYQEIAARLDCTPKAVDNALQRVRRKLR